MHGDNSALTRHAVKALDREDVPNAEKILDCYIHTTSFDQRDVDWIRATERRIRALRSHTIAQRPEAQPEELSSPRALNSDPKTPPSTIEPAIDIQRTASPTPPLHIEPLLQKPVPVTKAPPPISVVGGHGTIHRPKPTEVPPDLPIDYPRTLVARTFVIIGEAVRKFPVQTQTLELCKYVISELTQPFRKALQNKVFRQDQALSRMHNLLHYLLVHNCDGEWLRSEVRKEVLKSDEWLTLAKEIAREIEDHTPVKAELAQDAPEAGGLEGAPGTPSKSHS